uniref:C-type lectin domain-containing protein n=1 Tax=Macrostomum lignano TaxID=282301 RepID=A0A1I8FCG0_9PLAT
SLNEAEDFVLPLDWLFLHDRREPMRSSSIRFSEMLQRSQLTELAALWTVCAIILSAGRLTDGQVLNSAVLCKADRCYNISILGNGDYLSSYCASFGMQKLDQISGVSETTYWTGVHRAARTSPADRVFAWRSQTSQLYVSSTDVSPSSEVFTSTEEDPTVGVITDTTINITAATRICMCVCPISNLTCCPAPASGYTCANSSDGRSFCFRRGDSKKKYWEAPTMCSLASGETLIDLTETAARVAFHAVFNTFKAGCHDTCLMAFEELPYRFNDSYGPKLLAEGFPLKEGYLKQKNRRCQKRLQLLQLLRTTQLHRTTTTTNADYHNNYTTTTTTTPTTTTTTPTYHYYHTCAEYYNHTYYPHPDSIDCYQAGFSCHSAVRGASRGH